MARRVLLNAFQRSLQVLLACDLLYLDALKSFSGCKTERSELWDNRGGDLHRRTRSRASLIPSASESIS